MTFTIETQRQARQNTGIFRLHVPVPAYQNIFARLIATLRARAATKRLMRHLRPMKPMRADLLPNRIREDIGLPALPPPLPTEWKLRR